MRDRVNARAEPRLRPFVSAGWRDSIAAVDIVLVNSGTLNRTLFTNMNQAAMAARRCDHAMPDAAFVCLLSACYYKQRVMRRREAKRSFLWLSVPWGVEESFSWTTGCLALVKDEAIWRNACRPARCRLRQPHTHKGSHSHPSGATRAYCRRPAAATPPCRLGENRRQRSGIDACRNGGSRPAAPVLIFPYDSHSPTRPHPLG